MDSGKYLDNVISAIDYIEENILDDELSMTSASKRAGFSEYHFHRIFSSLVGESIADYIRARRLSQAALELKQSDESILALSLKYGFDSQETFTRAFKRLFGLTPGAFRKQVKLEADMPLNIGLKLPLKKSLLEHILARGFDMKPEIVKIDDCYVVGMGAGFIPKASKDINMLWQKFMPRMKEIEANSNLAYGICTSKHPEIDLKDGECMVYVAALPVDERAAVPLDMVKVKIEGGEYAKFTHKGPILEIARTVDYIWGQWQPEAPYKLRDAVDFELYDERFNPESADSEVDIYVPLERR